MEGLINRKSKLERRLEELNNKQRSYSKQVNDIILELSLIKNTLNPPAITVSDHALVRYMERFALVQLDEYKNHLIKRAKTKIYSHNGTGSFNIDNIKVIVRDFNIITIINKDL